jgi:GxxExxY protein
VNEITEAVIGAAIDVHRAIGLGLLESAYTQCLCYELSLRKLPFALESLPVLYKGLKLDCGYRLDLVVADDVVVEIKAVEHLTPLHEAQLVTYLRLGGWQAGLLINFNVAVIARWDPAACARTPGLIDSADGPTSPTSESPSPQPLAGTP